MDTERTMIPASVYHSWIQDASNTISRRGRLSKTRNGTIATRISELMDLPPLALINGGSKFPAEVHYPASLLKQWKQWKKCTAHTRSSPSSEHSAQSLPESPSSHSPLEGLQAPFPPEYPPEDYSHVGSHRADSIEMVRNQLENMGIPATNEDSSATTVSPQGLLGNKPHSFPALDLGMISICCGKKCEPH